MKRMTLATVLATISGTMLGMGSVAIDDASALLELRGDRIPLTVLDPAAASAGLVTLAQRE